MPRRLSSYYFKLEKRILSLLKLKGCKGSGNTWLEKEDGYNDKVLVQIKTTEKRNVFIKHQDWQLLNYHANMSNKMPVFINHLINENETFITFKLDSEQAVELPDDILALFELGGGDNGKN